MYEARKTSYFFALHIVMFCFGVFKIAYSQEKAAPETSILIEAEAFQLQGGWQMQRDKDALGQQFLIAPTPEKPASDAFTAVAIPASGTYHFWTRARDYTSSYPGKRRFRLMVDGAPANKESGAHGREGFAWEMVKTLPLKAGLHVLTLNDSTHYYGRCDAIFITTGSADPNQMDFRRLASFRRAPKLIEIKGMDPFASAPAWDEKSAAEKMAQVENEAVRVVFESRNDNKGARLIGRRTELRVNGQWVALPGDGRHERLFILYAPASKVRFMHYPYWDYTQPTREIDFAGQKIKAEPESNNPFFAGEMMLLLARGARQVSAREVEMKYETPDGQTATGLWTLDPARSDVALALSFHPKKDGCYSIGFCAFQGLRREETQFALLPPLYQFQRLPDHPLLVSGSLTPHPIALTQSAFGPSGADVFCAAVIAEPTRLPFQWPSATNSAYGFSIVNPAGEAQPCAFSPVMGLAGSQCRSGDTLQAAFRVLARAGDWRQALEYCSDKIMGVSDYRRPVNASLSDAALNMMDLMKDGAVSGWDDELKGFYNIEMRATVTHAAPLAIVSAAILSRDERLFTERALPTIAFTLSRPTAHFGVSKDAHAPVSKLKVPGDFYGASYWQGLHALLGSKNPWIADMALVNGVPRHSGSYNSSPLWTETLAAYRLQPKPELLREACKQADEFIEKQFHSRQQTPISFEAFYNISFYPYWWDLVDLFELTRDKKYLDAAEQGAFHTIAGLWSQPPNPAKDQKLYPGGDMVAFSEGIPWYKGDAKFRLGFPRKPGDLPEKSVPAWQVSPVGLGLEQPSTYFRSDGRGHRNIMASAWAPHLLRMNQYTGRDIYLTYARNSVIGRYANYPGYYLCDFTDLPQNPRYPFQGPDMTAFYYHHIPVQLCFTLDFLVTQATARSKGAISFPHSIQKNYAYFMNRIFGQETGKIYGEDGTALWLERRIVKGLPPEADWLAARGPKRFYLMLMSQSREPMTVSPQLDTEAIGLDWGAGGSESFLRYENAASAPVKMTKDQLRSVVIPPMGIVTLSLPAKSRDALSQTPPLKNGHLTRDLGKPWGQMHAFRIRTPFCNDALYMTLTEGPSEGAEVSLKVDGLVAPAMQPAPRKRFPYEFIVYPLSSASPIKCLLQGSIPGQPAAQCEATIEFAE